MEMSIFSLSQHPTTSRVFERHPDARGAGFADDLTIYDDLSELRQRLGEDTNLRYNMGKLKIYIPGITRDRARELVLKFINQDPLLESLRELYDKDIAEPELDIINVTGMTCVGVPMGSHYVQGRQGACADKNAAGRNGSLDQGRCGAFARLAGGSWPWIEQTQ